MSTEMITFYGAILSLLLGVAGYFLKRTMSKVDSHGEKIQTIEKNYVEKSELREELEKDRIETKEQIASVKKECKGNTDKLASDVADIKDKFLTKEDFYRSQADTNKRLDKIYDLILEMKGGNEHG